MERLRSSKAELQRPGKWSRTLKQPSFCSFCLLIVYRVLLSRPMGQRMEPTFTLKLGRILQTIVATGLQLRCRASFQRKFS